MPLIKKVATITAEPPKQDAPTPEQEAHVTATKKSIAKATSNAPMTKDNYWRQREERDIAKDKHIRLSGILQALLNSVNFGQYCTVADKNAYLDEVKKAALELATFVTEKA
jgi:hypothetical protein